MFHGMYHFQVLRNIIVQKQKEDDEMYIIYKKYKLFSFNANTFFYHCDHEHSRHVKHHLGFHKEKVM